MRLDSSHSSLVDDSMQLSTLNGADFCNYVAYVAGLCDVRLISLSRSPDVPCCFKNLDKNIMKLFTLRTRSICVRSLVSGLKFPRVMRMRFQQLPRSRPIGIWDTPASSALQEFLDLGCIQRPKFVDESDARREFRKTDNILFDARHADQDPDRRSTRTCSRFLRDDAIASRA